MSNVSLNIYPTNTHPTNIYLNVSPTNTCPMKVYPTNKTNMPTFTHTPHTTNTTNKTNMRDRDGGGEAGLTRQEGVSTALTDGLKRVRCDWGGVAW